MSVLFEPTMGDQKATSTVVVHRKTVVLVVHEASHESHKHTT